MKFTLDGRPYEIEPESVRISELIVLKKAAGINGLEVLGEGLRTGDPEAWKALVWLAVRRADGDDAPKWREFDFEIGALDVEEEIEPEDAPDALDPTEDRPAEMTSSV